MPGRRRPASIRVLGYPNIRAAAEAWARETTAAQGLPFKVTDPLVIRRVVAILHEARAEVEKPANGDLRIETIRYIVNRTRDNAFAHCNGKEVDAMGLFYKSNEKFTGRDTHHGSSV